MIFITLFEDTETLRQKYSHSCATFDINFKYELYKRKRIQSLELSHKTLIEVNLE